MTNPRYKFLNNLNKIELDSNRLLIGVSGTDIMTIDSSNVGIGITSSGDKLDVNGSLNIASGNDYKINGTSVLNATTLSSSVVNSSLTSIGTLTSLTVSNGITANDYNINGNSVLNETTLGSSVVNSSLTSIGTLSGLNLSDDLTIDVTGEHQSILGSNNNKSGLVVRSESNNDSYITVIKESTSASYCFGIDASDNNKLKINYLNSLTPVEPSTGANYLSMEPPGNIEIPVGSLTVSNGITGNEVFPTVCSTIGSLGYILLDEMNTIDGTFDNNIVSLDNQSIDTHAMYKYIFRGTIDGNGGIPIIRIQFRDTGGAIVAGGTTHWRFIVGFGGTPIENNNNQDYSILMSHNSGVSGILYYSGQITITLNGTEEKECIFTGQGSTHAAAGTDRSGYNSTGGLNDLSTITTRITGFGLQAVNFDAVTIASRCYRMI